MGTEKIEGALHIKPTLSKTRNIWIDNLKLIAAYGVLAGHCYSLFIGQNQYGQEQLTSTASFFLKVTSFLYNGDMWVIVFCMLSGYFAASKHFTGLIDLLKSVIKRYMRFVGPLLLLAAVIALLSVTIGFELRTDYVANEWLGLPMRVTLKSLLKMIFMFSPTLDGPLWTLRAMFVSGILMYIINFVLDYLNIKHKATIYIIVAGITFFAGIMKVEFLLCSCCFLGGY